jgi:hypothetical protein
MITKSMKKARKFQGLMKWDSCRLGDNDFYLDFVEGEQSHHGTSQVLYADIGNLTTLYKLTSKPAFLIHP